MNGLALNEYFISQCLIDDDRTIRLASFQALECILKICKVKRKRVVVSTKEMSERGEANNLENGHSDKAAVRPGIREDNLWLQYKSEMSETELAEYWEKPFLVNPSTGFYAWSKPEVRLHVVGKEWREMLCSLSGYH